MLCVFLALSRRSVPWNLDKATQTAYDSKSNIGRLAQLVARMLSMHEVAGSIPAVSMSFASIDHGQGLSLLHPCGLRGMMM